jgi:hypothetical protein
VGKCFLVSGEVEFRINIRREEEGRGHKEE